MKWLTIPYIKQHSRIDYNCEDANLELYGSAAEDTVLSVIRRTLNNVKDKYETVPPALYHAALMLTDLSYQQRSPITPTNLSVIPYTFDMIIADYMRLDKATDLQAERDYLLELLADVKTNLDFAYTEIASPTDAQTTAYKNELEIISGLNDRYANFENPTNNICASLRAKVATVKAESENLFNE